LKEAALKQRSDSAPEAGGWGNRLKCRHSGASRNPSTQSARGGARKKKLDSGFRRGDGEFGELLAEQLLLLIHIFFRDIAGRNQSVDAGRQSLAPLCRLLLKKCWFSRTVRRDNRWGCARSSLSVKNYIRY
jgi:hypothetical protein